MNENLRYWDKLCKTDPDHTSPFNRPGGFRGTAIKPIWTIKRMTEVFGPVGIGWGTEKPDFQMVTVGEEIAVYCTLCCWYTDGGARYFVFGMGGDKVSTRRNDGKMQVDDEAYKKAFTDALGNALKHIGASADVHMGMFEDSKYVNATRKEFDKIEAAQVPAQPPTTPSLGPDLDAFAGKSGEELQEAFVKLAFEYADQGTEAFRGWWKTLSLNNRSILDNILPKLKARAMATDDKMLPRVEVVKMNGKPNWEATTKALVKEFVGFMTAEECEGFEELNAATINMLRSGDRNQYEAYHMVAQSHYLSLAEKGDAA